MNLEIIKVRYEGNIANERVVLSVTAADDVGNYLVTQVETHADETRPSNKVLRCFWFPDQPVKKGDLVVLYTKKGTYKEKQNTHGSTTYFYYWGLDAPIWHHRRRTLVVMELADWDSSVISGAGIDEE